MGKGSLGLSFIFFFCIVLFSLSPVSFPFPLFVSVFLILFFSLPAVVRLIEYLPGAADCKHYRFHRLLSVCQVYYVLCVLS